MPSIAGFIQSLLSEDMYATGMIKQMDERIGDLNNGQLRLLLRFCEDKIPGLTNKTVLDAYVKLFRKASSEAETRHEEEVRGERERLRQLKAAHAGVNAKAWDTAHASLDKELVKFQKFIKSKARRIAEEEVTQEAMEKHHGELLAMPARRESADTRRRFWWATGICLSLILGPLVALCLLSMGKLWTVIMFYAVCLIIAAMCCFLGVVRGMVVEPTLDDAAIEGDTRARAKDKLQVFRDDVRRNYQEFQNVFTADMKWRDEWAEGRRQDRRRERRTATSKIIGESGRVAPDEADLPAGTLIARPRRGTALARHEETNEVDNTPDSIPHVRASKRSDPNNSAGSGEAVAGHNSVALVQAVQHQSQPVVHEAGLQIHKKNLSSGESSEANTAVKGKVAPSKQRTRGPYQGCSGASGETPQGVANFRKMEEGTVEGAS